MAIIVIPVIKIYFSLILFIEKLSMEDDEASIRLMNLCLFGHVQEVVKGVGGGCTALV